MRLSIVCLHGEHEPPDVRLRASRALLMASSRALMSVTDVERFTAPTRRMGTPPSSSEIRSDLDGDRPNALRENGMSRMSRSPSAFVRYDGPDKLLTLLDRGRPTELDRCKFEPAFALFGSDAPLACGR